MMRLTLFSRHSRRHGEIRFSGPRRAYAQSHRVLGDGAHIVLLPDRFGFYGPPLGRDAYHVAAQLAYPVLASGADHAEDVAHLLLVDALSLGGHAQKVLHGLLRADHVLRLTGDLQLFVPVGDAYIEFFFDDVQILVKGTEYAQNVLYPIRGYGSVHAESPFKGCLSFKR